VVVEQYVILSSSRLQNEKGKRISPEVPKRNVSVNVYRNLNIDKAANKKTSEYACSPDDFSVYEQKSHKEKRRLI